MSITSDSPLNIHTKTTAIYMVIHSRHSINPVFINTSINIDQQLQTTERSYIKNILQISNDRSYQYSWLKWTDNIHRPTMGRHTNADI